jgi:hypothetical protein
MKSFFIHSFRSAFSPAIVCLLASLFPVKKRRRKHENKDCYSLVKVFAEPFKRFEQFRFFSLELFKHGLRQPEHVPSQT